MAQSQEKLEEIKQQVLEWHREAEDGNRPVFKRMTKGERFKIGGRLQWDSNDLKYNDAHRKHSITINRVLPTVNFLDGQQVRNPRDLTAVAYKGGNATRARLLTALMKQIGDSSHGRHQQSMAFDNGVTTGRGYLGIDTSYLQDPFGDLRRCTYGPFDVLPDACRKRYDPNDWQDGWRYVFIEEWEPKAKVDFQYPRKKDAIGAAHYGVTSRETKWFGSRIIAMTRAFFSNSKPWTVHDDYRDTEDDEESQTDGATKWQDHYRVTTCYWRDWRKGAYLQRVDAPDWYEVLYKDSDISYARKLLEETQAQNIRLIEKDNTGAALVVPVLMRTKMVGDVLLDHTEDPFDGIWQYPIVPFNAYFENGYEFGVVDNLIGPQTVCNWSWSMSLNIIRKIANPGWLIGKAQAAALEHLENHGSEDGLILQEKNYGKVGRLDPPDYQGVAQLHNIADMSGTQMAEIANVRMERPEFDKKGMSGIAIGRKQASSDQGQAILFGNWDMTLEILGNIEIEHILRRKTYTREEIKQIVDDEDLIDAALLAEARKNIMAAAQIPPIPPQAPPAELLAQLNPLAQTVLVTDYQQHLAAYMAAMMEVEEKAPVMAVEMLLDELKEIQQGKTKFGVKSSLSESATTFREEKFWETMALNDVLIKSGERGVGRKVLVQASDAPHKEEILQQEQAIAAPAPGPALAPAMAAA